MGRQLRAPVILGLGLLGALVAAAAFSSASVSYRSADRDGARVAEVLIGEDVVIVLRTASGGYTPVERAEIVASRLRSALSSEVAFEDVEAVATEYGHAVYVREWLIVAVYPAEADAHGATTEALAGLWRDNILLALGLAVLVEPPAEEPPAEGPPAEEPAPGFEPYYEPGAEEPVPAESGVGAEAAPAEELDWTGTAQKWVPIFSLETEGVYVGAAQVAGPKSQVDRVKGVAELRLNFRSIGRIYAYIPVSSISTKLDRVQGVSVWATGDVQLAGF